jgi:hypothetical protein
VEVADIDDRRHFLACAGKDANDPAPAQVRVEVQPGQVPFLQELTATVLAQNARVADLLRQVPGQFSLTRDGTTVNVRVRLPLPG